MIRDHPDAEKKAGDCEDFAREAQLAFDWLIRSKSETPLVNACIELAQCFECFTIDAVVEESPGIEIWILVRLFLLTVIHFSRFRVYAQLHSIQTQGGR